MIVAITSLTPRLTLRTPATPAHAAPTTIASNRQNVTCNTAGSRTCVAIPAVSSTARRVWPSTPMLNRPILNPMATAVADSINGTARRVASRNESRLMS